MKDIDQDRITKRTAEIQESINKDTDQAIDNIGITSNELRQNIINALLIQRISHLEIKIEDLRQKTKQLWK